MEWLHALSSKEEVGNPLTHLMPHVTPGYVYLAFPHLGGWESQVLTAPLSSSPANLQGHTGDVEQESCLGTKPKSPASQTRPHVPSRINGFLNARHADHTWMCSSVYPSLLNLRPWLMGCHILSQVRLLPAFGSSALRIQVCTSGFL